MKATSVLAQEWARLPEAMTFAPMSRSQFYVLINSGRLESRRVGGCRFVNVASLKKLFSTAPRKPTKAVSRMMRERGRAGLQKQAAAKNGAK